MFADISIRIKYSGLGKLNIFIKINSQQGNRGYKIILTGTLQFTRMFIRVHSGLFCYFSGLVRRKAQLLN